MHSHLVNKKHFLQLSWKEIVTIIRLWRYVIFLWGQYCHRPYGCYLWLTTYISFQGFVYLLLIHWSVCWGSRKCK